MIYADHAVMYCVEDITNIENYEKAINDNTQTYVCHHRLETHTSDGERRKVDISKEELIALGMYYSRPVEELIFMTKSDHTKLHNEHRKWSKGGHKLTEEAKRKIAEASKGRRHSEETKLKISNSNKGKHSKSFSEDWKNKLSESHKGQIPWNKGKKMSEEAIKKNSDSHKGHKASEETRKKLSEALKGRKLSEEWKKKISEANKGKHRSEETKRRHSALLKGKHWKVVDGKRVWY